MSTGSPGLLSFKNLDQEPIQILLIEDNPDDAGVIEALLASAKSSRFVLEHAKRLKEGLKRLKDGGIDIVLLDLNLPDSTGMKSLQKLHEEAPAVPVVILTGLEDAKMTLRAVEEGAQDFLQKGQVTDPMLEHSLRYAISRHQNLQLLKEYARDLQSSEARFRSLITRSQDPVLVVDLEGHICFANGQATKAFGKSATQMRGKPFEFPLDTKHTREVRVTNEAGEQCSLVLSVRKTEWERNPAYLVSLRDVTQRKRAEEALIEASEREQQRIGQELHDSLGQDLLGIALISDDLCERLKSLSLQEAVSADKISKLVDQAIERTQSLARGLYPIALSTHDLTVALEELAHQAESLFHVACHMQLDHHVQVEEECAAHLYRIAQEAITNAVKHGKARNIHIGLGEFQDDQFLEVSDDGSGFSGEESATGMGLRIMNYRAERIGGVLKLGQSDLGGTSVCVNWQGKRLEKLPEAGIRHEPVTKPVTKHRILVVDDHPIVREGFTTLIEREHDLFVCGVAEDAESTLSAIQSLQPDLALVDISLPGMDGIELTKRLRDRHPKIPVLVLSMHSEALYAERALKAGARGYVMKREGTANLIKAIRQVLAGDVYVSEQTNASILMRMIDGQEHVDKSPMDSLTDRELEVFHLVGEGRSTREIADKLHISISTVESHRARMMKKLSIQSSNELTVSAARWLAEGRPG